MYVSLPEVPIIVEGAEYEVKKIIVSDFLKYSL